MPISTRGKSDRANLRTVGHTGALELLVEEAAHKDLEPFAQGFVVVDVPQRKLCHAVELFGREAVAKHIEQVEIVQLVGADQILGLLRDLAVFSGGEKLGGNGGVQYVAQCRRDLGVAVCLVLVGAVRHKVTNQRFGD